MEIYTSKPNYIKNEGLIKTCKIDAPIGLIVNWRKAGACKLANMFSEKVKTYIPVPYVFNVTTNTYLIKNLTDIRYNQNL
jgi:hypothetical protein